MIPGTLSSVPDREARQARRADLIIFFVSGAVIATWVANVPAVKDRFGLDDASLGFTLLAISAGSVSALFAAGTLVDRYGSRVVTRVSTVICCLALPILMLVTSYPLLVVALFGFGMAFSSMDVAMNAQAVAIETRYQRPIMSTFHALYSLGGLVGAGVAGVLLSTGLSPLGEALVATVAVATLSVLAIGHLLPDGERSRGGVRLALPTGPLALLGVLTLLAMVSEGAVGDWGAVYLRDIRHAPAGLAATGFAAFSFAMMAGRFAGDWLRMRFSPRLVVRTSGAVSAICLGFGLIVPSPLAALIGFAGVGLGLANLVPILFSAAGRTPGVATGTGLAAVATAGYSGFLIGPPLIGLVSQATSLTFGLGVVVVFSALIALLAGEIRQSA